MDLERLVQETVEKTLGKQTLMLIQLTTENALLKTRVVELEAQLVKPQ